MERENLRKAMANVAQLVSGVAFDSRRVRDGFAFVAIPGVKEDGSAYIRDAISRGAKVVISEKREMWEAEKVDEEVTFLEVADARLALSVLASLYAGEPSRKMDVFGVTGTNGKTTVAGLVRDILEAAGRSCGLLSTVEYSWRGHCEEASRTTPDAITIHQSLEAMRVAGAMAASMEVSSHALDQARVASVRYVVAGFTNLSQDHFDYHHGFEEYYRCKRRLFEQMGKETPGAFAVINADDPYGGRLLEESESLHLRGISYSIEKPADIYAGEMKLSASASHFVLHAFGQKAEVEMGLIGRYNISNALCAAGMALANGVAFEEVVRVLNRAKPRWGRLEQISGGNGVQVFVDYAHTPDAIEKVLGALREVAKGRLTIVFGCGGDRDRAKRPLMAKTAARLADYVVLTSDNPRTEDPNVILDEVEEGIIGSGTPYQREPDRRKAIEFALSDAGSGDVVLIAGKGHENYQEINGVHYPFDDREVVRCAVARRRPPTPADARRRPPKLSKENARRGGETGATRAGRSERSE